MDTNLGNHQRLADGFAKADTVVLYEGLPHPGFERSVLEEELKTKRTVSFHGYPFYEELLQLKEADAKELIRLLTDSKSFQTYVKGKRCGGFHPDYLVVCRQGEDEYRCLICLGCGEVKMFGPKVELHCDVAQKAHDKLKELLKPYRKQRPVKDD